MWRLEQTVFKSLVFKNFRALLGGLVAGAALVALVPSTVAALPLPEWASTRIISAVEARLPVAITGAEGFSISLGDTIETLTIGIESVSISEYDTATAVTLQKTALAIRILDLLMGTVAIESITIGNLDWHSMAVPPHPPATGSGSLGGVLADVRPLTRQLDRLRSTLERVTVENFSKNLQVSNDVMPLTLEGEFAIASTAAGWQGTLNGMVRRAASRVGTVAGTVAISGMNPLPEFRIALASDTTALGPILNLPPAVPFVQFTVDLAPEWDSAGRLAAVDFAFDGTGDPSGVTGDLLGLESLVMHGAYRPEHAVLDIEDLVLVASQAELTGNGTVLLEFTDADALGGVSGSAFFETLDVRTNRFLDNPLPPLAGSLSYAFDFAADRDHYAQFEFASPVTRGEVRYVAHADSGSDVAVRFDTLPARELIALWPRGIFDNTLRWLTNAVKGGSLHDFTGLFRIPDEGPVASLITFQFQDFDFIPVRGHLPVRASRGHVELTENEMQIFFAEGWVDVPDKGVINLAASRMHIPKIRDAGHPSRILVNFIGDLGAVLDLVDREPFTFMTRVNMSPDIATGATEGVVEVRMPLLDTVQAGDIKVSVTAVIKDLVVYGLWPGQPIRANYAVVAADERKIGIMGEAFVGDVLVNAGWQLVYDGSRHSVSGTVRLDKKLFTQLNARHIGSFISGDEDATFVIDLNTPGVLPFQLTSPLTGLAVALPEIGWRKPAGVPVEFLVSGQFGERIMVDQVRLASPDLDLDGSLRLADTTGRIERISLRNVRWGQAYNGPAELILGADGRLIRISMPGTLAIGAMEADLSGSRAGGDRSLDISIGAIVFSETIRMTDINGQFGGPEEYDGRLEASLNGAVPIRIGVDRQGTQTRLIINADDAGAVAKEMGLTGNLIGGNLAIDLTTQPHRGVYTGNLQVTDITVRKLPVLLLLLSTIALTGLLDQMDSGGISFAEIRARFAVTPNTITISNGIANSSSIGLTAEGTYDIPGKAMDFAGSLTPNIFIGHALNTILPIGRLVGQREGEGLGTIRYRLRGPAAAPSIETQALSILSPIGSGNLGASENN